MSQDHAARPPSNVLPAPHPMLGRDALLDDLCGALAPPPQARLITLMGPGGMGKTRLAREVALRQAQDPRWRGGVWWVDLADADSLDALCVAVADALDLSLSGAAPPRVALGEALARRPALLLALDNFEQLVAHGPDTVAAWLAQAPALACLVTSRERLGLAGERTWALPPLEGPGRCADPADAPAYQLLRARMEAHQRAPHPDSPQGRALAQVADRLDGLPLALELAAAQTAVLSPAQLLARLDDDPLGLLVGGQRSSPDRHRTLRRALDGSWALLSHAERLTLAQCAVFRGGFDLDAAEAVLALPPDAPPVHHALRLLHDKSLLQIHTPPIDDAPRRFALFVSVRRYAAERLDALDAPDALLARHAEHFARWGHARAQELGTASAHSAFQRLALEHANLHAAADHPATAPLTRLRLALALTPLVAHRGPFAPHLQRLRDALAQAPPDAPPGLTAQALLALGRLRTLQGDPRAALDDLQLAAARALDALDHATQARALDALASAHRALGDAPAALDLYLQALALARDHDALHAEATSLGNLAGLRYELGQHTAARRDMEDAIVLLRDCGDLRAEGVLVGNLALIDQERGQLQRARDALLRALDLHRALHNRRFEAIALYDLGGLHAELRQPHLALPCYASAADLLDNLGDPTQRLLALAAQAAACADLTPPDLPRARALIRAARRLLPPHTSPALPLTLDLYAAHIDLAYARQAHALDPNTPLASYLAPIDALIHRAQPLTASSDDLRLALRLLRLQRDLLGDLHAALVVAHDAAWIQPPDAPKIDLTPRPTLQRLALHLALLRVRTPGTPAPRADLILVAWPDEHIVPSAALNRLNVAISTLRKSGLRPWLLTQDGGYLLDPNTPCVFAAPP